MRLPQTVEYALRAMSFLAAQDGGQAVNAATLSQKTAIPPAYLSKVMRRLVRAGLVDGRKGHGGGFTLARPPAGIHFREVLDAVDYHLEPNHCAFGWAECDPDAPCPLHPAWSAMKESFAAWAQANTLAAVGPAARKRARKPSSSARGRS